jgi:glutathione transport system permease protein
MIPLIFQRILMAIPTVFGILLAGFLVIHLSPGDPALLMAGPNALPEVVENMRHQLGLDQPLIFQFGKYLLNLLHGDMGRSMSSGWEISTELARTLPRSVELMLLATLWSILAGIPLGIVSAVKRGTWVDRFCTAFAVFGVSLPVFFMGLMLMYVFAFKLKIMPMGEYGGPLWTLKGLKHIALPAITLGMFSTASLARVTRSTMLEVLGQDYVRTARAKGLSEKAVVYRHALKNALIPVITLIGTNMARLIGGAVVAETIFTWPGMGRMMIVALLSKDVPVIQGCLLAIGIMVTMLNLGVDIVYTFVDPRMKHSGRI